MTLKTFAPNGSTTTTLTANGTTSTSVAVDANSAVVRVYNAGPDTAYIRFGSATDAATTSYMPIPSGNTELFTKGQVGYAAAICDTAKAATLYLTSGEGM